ncbi:MAG: MurR/RpiR family transcriptional regulator [Anaerococcus prevotii]|uniref:MurR/RpiR family transcriptional regulator n=1 Tax=Anaerococcus prevotii TaxID=33034 RepID=UPI0029035380|nr:MurR/RpiR family transcriptional regulator [Anaerococcus prevotii]MDU2558449.1 MurR/RpiR family transcriptional regulator [Anaerococcus prevotii]MDU2585150.1 MurR/RpiR family transcriptional regulator [Anaerococcus prevotii]
MENNFFDKIEEISDDLTKSESDLVEYIIENKNDVINYNITELAEKTKLSIATISRFSRKMGYRNFQRLKTDMNLSFAEESMIFSTARTDSESKSLLDTIVNSNINYLDSTIRSLDCQKVDKICTILNNSYRYNIFGSDFSSIYCTYLSQNLSNTKLIGNYTPSINQQIQDSKKLTSNDCAIIIDYDKEENKDMTHIFKILKINRVPVILFTNKSFNYLERNSDVSIYTSPITKKDTLPVQSNYFVIFDYLFLSYKDTYS